MLSLKNGMFLILVFIRVKECCSRKIDLEALVSDEAEVFVINVVKACSRNIEELCLMC